jgi:hypothetical protein
MVTVTLPYEEYQALLKAAEVATYRAVSVSAPAPIPVPVVIPPTNRFNVGDFVENMYAKPEYIGKVGQIVKNYEDVRASDIIWLGIINEGILEPFSKPKHSRVVWQALGNARVFKTQ